MTVGEDEGFYRMGENGSYSAFPTSRLLFYIMTKRNNMTLVLLHIYSVQQEVNLTRSKLVFTCKINLYVYTVLFRVE